MFILLISLLAIVLINSIVLFFLFRKSVSKTAQFESLDKSLEKFERGFREEIAKSREEGTYNSKQLREEVAGSSKNFNDSITGQLISLTKINEEKLNNMRKTIEDNLKSIQDDNSKKLEKMRETVDEKLHSTLERRLGESFKLVSDRLELVHKGLGEMQTLANGVGDLKKVLTNVKTRGTWGEIQLGALLEEILSPEQYAKNIITKKGSKDNVEFAIKLPGRDTNPVWIPVDAKFPKEDYERLLEAQEQCNITLINELSKALENRIKMEAKNIKDKYIDPPNTTDFGILFLPTEGLYAEIQRRAGLCDFLRREHKIAVTGPSNFAAFLNSLQMGFRTLAIEKRAGEVWNLLSAVKTEFGKFGEILDKTHKKLQEASNTIENAARKSRTIERKLKDVQVLPSSEKVELIEEAEEVVSILEEENESMEEHANAKTDNI